MSQKCRRCMQDEHLGSRGSGHEKVVRLVRGAKVTLEKTHRMHRSREARAEEPLAAAHGLHAHVESLEFGRLERSADRSIDARGSRIVTMRVSCRRERRKSAHRGTDNGGDRLVIRRGIREAEGLSSARRGRGVCRGRPGTESNSHKSEGRIAAGRITCYRRGRLVIRRGRRKSESISAGQGNGARGARSDTRMGSRRCGRRRGAHRSTDTDWGRPVTRRGSCKGEGRISAGRGGDDRGARFNTRRGRARKLP